MYVILSAKNIDEILELQDKVFKSLKKEERAFLLPKPKEKLLEHFAKGSSFQGYVINGKLIAQSLIINPTPDFPDTGMVDMKDQGDISKGITVLQGLIVDPDYRGQGLSTKMVKSWLSTAAINSKETALAEVEISNYRSYGGFIDSGLVIESAGIDTSDGTKVLNLKGSPKQIMLTQTFNSCAAKCELACLRVNAENVDKIFSALKDNYKGMFWDRAKKEIIMSKNCKRNEYLKL